MIKTRNYQELNEAIAAFSEDSQSILKDSAKHNYFTPHSAHKRRKATSKKKNARDKNQGRFARPKSPKQKTK